MIVVDASVAVKWFVAEAGADEADSLLGGSEALIAPDFAIYETLNVLRRKHRRGEIRPGQLDRASIELVGFFDTLVPAQKLIERTMILSQELDHGVYDCAYLACAIEHNATLITSDEVFVRKAFAKGFDGAVLSLNQVR